MAPPSSSITPSLPPPSHLFTPIQEGNETEELEERHRFTPPSSSTTPTTLPTTDSTITHHCPTPLHQPGSKKTRKPEPDSISCNNCRPTTREKTSVTVVPVDHHHTLSPNLFKSLISSISRRSPKPEKYNNNNNPVNSQKPEKQNKHNNMVSELSHKLLQATRKRDEAILEASRLKYTMSELEKKLNRLEIYCHNLKSGLDICHQAQTQGPINSQPKTHHDILIKNFLGAVSESRTRIRFLSKSICSQLKLMGVKVLEKLSLVLKNYDFKLSTSSSVDNNNLLQSKALQYYLEAILSAAFYQDFETSGFSGTSMDHILNPIDKGESNYSLYTELKDLTWEQVLNKGTKFFSEEFSKFCDRKMSEIVGLLGWTRAWPEQLLQAFFGASKSVWLVHLLANSVHPKLLIFRVDKGARFDPVYMEDMGGDKGKLIPTMVKVMVAPGFYVFDNVVKCKVISRYYNYSNSNYNSLFNGNDM